MEVKIEITEQADGTHTLHLTLDGQSDVVGWLSEGYATPHQAVAALVDCLTTAPPDMESYDLGLTRLGALVDEVTEITDAIGQLGSRLNDAEAKLEAVPMPAPAPKANRLLPGRDAAAGHAPQAGTARPAPGPIRRRTNSLPEEQRNLAGRVHGQNFGGPIRRGAGVALPDTQDTLPEDGQE